MSNKHIQQEFKQINKQNENENENENEIQKQQKEKEELNESNNSIIKRHPGYGPIPEGMSKSAYKKQIKRQLREATHKEWIQSVRAKEKARKKLKKQLIKEGKLEANNTLDKPKRPKEEDRIPNGSKIVLDMDFEGLMSDKEISSIGGQIQRCYSSNRRTCYPFDLYVTSLNGTILQYMDSKMKDYNNWKEITITNQPFIELFEKENLIYLTADSETILNDLEPNMVYIIGGLVDKNRYKGLTLNRAKELNIKTAQLPIGNYIQMASRKVLTVNQVYDILIQFVELKDWQKAFEKVIPLRKFRDGNKKDKNNENSSNQESDDNDKDIE